MANELARRGVHAAGAVFPGLYLVELVTWPQLRLILLVGAAVAGGLELLRLVFEVDWRPLDRFFDALLREYEEDSIAAYAQYVFGGAFAGVVFDPAFAVPAMLMLTIADPISGFAGSGELRRIKRPPALIAMFTSSFLLAWFARWAGPATYGGGVTLPELTLTAAVAAALGATVADGAKGVFGRFVLDDDLTIPIASVVAGWAAFHYLPDITLVVG